MGIRLLRLLASGPDRENAIIKFSEKSTLIYGPSDTGKSHIFKVLNYLLGSDSVPDVDLTEGEGYNFFFLEVGNTVTNETYTIVRGVGGGESVHTGSFDNHTQENLVEIGAGELLKKLAGVQKNIIYRKAGMTGAVTAGSLRHWCLLSETKIGQDRRVIGDPTDQTTNAATVSLLLTGNDDTGIQSGVSKDAKERAKGGKDAVEVTIKRLNADIPEGATLIESRESLMRVDRVLNEMTELHNLRSSKLRGARASIAAASNHLRNVEKHLALRGEMLGRFELLDDKYKNDLSRLVAVDEGIAFLDLLDDVPCPLCGTPLIPINEIDHVHLKTSDAQRRALAAEARKIQKLQSELALTIEVERSNVHDLSEQRDSYLTILENLEKEEEAQIQIAGLEFEYSPVELAEQRSILYKQISAFEEIDRLKAEAERFAELSKAKAAAISRAFGDNATKLSDRVLILLRAWGFEHIKSIAFDVKIYDISIDGRRRLSFGMGTRSVFMTAFAVAIMEHSLSIGAPHPGILVIDSPLKTYYEKEKKNDDPSVAPETVKERFYKWLSNWDGAGQIIILENKIPSQSTRAVDWIEFTDDSDMGRQGFYLNRTDV